MANPNTKIIIQEHDASVPRGAGVSSDVAYIPGLARTYVETKTGPVEFLKTDLIAAGISEAELTDGSAGYVYQGLKNGTDHYYYKKTPRNVPVLCYTVDEFVSYFGEVPYQFTAEDVVEGTYSHTCQEGGYDRSYIYAKELLQSGLTIYYENISPEETSPVNIATVTLSTADTALFTFALVKPSITSAVIASSVTAGVPVWKSVVLSVPDPFTTLSFSSKIMRWAIFLPTP